MKRICLSVAALAVALAACGGEAAPQAQQDAAYCAIARALEQDNIFARGALDPERPEASAERIAAFEEQAKRAIAAAPETIKSSWELLVDGTLDFAREVQKVGYDFRKLAPESLQRFGDRRFDEAGAAIAEYNERVCGITPSPAAS